VVYHACIDLSRRTSIREHDSLKETFPSSEIENQGLAEELSSALLSLPTTVRAATLLVDVHGLSYDEAAAVLDCRRGTVGSRVSNGRRLLRDALSNHRPD
jgi:DNA-directed RNA polymerase specialized sigma24 family protein